MPNSLNSLVISEEHLLFALQYYKKAAIIYLHLATIEMALVTGC